MGVGEQLAAAAAHGGSAWGVGDGDRDPDVAVFDPGNGDAPVSCPGPGRPWTEADGNTATDRRWLRVRVPVGDPGRPVDGDHRITWSVAWTSNTGAGGTFPALSTATTSSFLVEQIQVVVQR